MMESLRELNEKVQKPRYKEEGNWYVRHILRDAAVPITWLLLHTPVTAHQVTLASLAIGVFGIALLAGKTLGAFLGGVIFLQLWYLLDHVDGQIARYRKTASLSGRFFDFVTHHLIHGILFFFLALNVYSRTGNRLFILWGFLASVSVFLFNLVHDTKYKTFFEKIETGGPYVLKAKEAAPSGTAPDRDLPFARRVFSFLHKSCEIHVVMNVLTAAAVINCLFFQKSDFRTVLFVYYGLVMPLLAAVKITYLIARGAIDQEFEERFSQDRNA